MKRAAAYTRVSTLPQLQQFGPGVQRDAITAYATRAGYEITDWYEDAITGKSAERDALSRLLDHAPRYEAVILSSVDRLARRVPIAYGVLAELMDTGLTVHAADMGIIDLDDDTSSVQFGIRTLFADQDHRRLTRRLHAAKVAKIASGATLWELNGYGWRAGTPDEREQHWARYMYTRITEVGLPTLEAELAAAGVTTRTGHPWRQAAIHKYLKNPTNKGEWQFGRSSGRILAVAPCPAIVDELTWNRAQESLAARRINRARYGSRTHLFPLTGRLTCAHCGRALSGRIENRRNHYYRCSGAYLTPPTCTARRYWPTATLHTATLDALQAAAADPATLAHILHTPAAPPINRAAMHADLDRRLTRLDVAYEAGAYELPEYLTKRAALKAERAALEQPAAPPPTPDTRPAATLLAAALEHADLATIATRTRLRATIDHDGTLSISIDPE